jgi:hypothetical protein
MLVVLFKIPEACHTTFNFFRVAEFLALPTSTHYSRKDWLAWLAQRLSAALS